MTEGNSNVTFDWVHPSWRDVVIDHLMRHPDDRRRFLRRCTMVGLELALSVSGGATGEREQPLLRTNEDWLELRRRMLELLPGQDQDDQRLLLEALYTSLLATEGDVLRTAVEETAQELCVAVVGEWDARGERADVSALDSFYRLSVLISRLPAGPQLRASVEAWLDDLEQGKPQKALMGLALAAENEPRALRQANWPDAYEAQTSALVEAAAEALEEAETVRAELSEVPEPDFEAVQYHAYEAFRWRQTLDNLVRAGAEDNKSRTVRSQLASVESALETWAENQQQEAAERAAEMAEDLDPGEDENEGPDPKAFSIAAVLADL